MMFKGIGALLVVMGCAAVGYLLSGSHLRRERLLQNLISTLEYMNCELQFQATPLPQLCRLAGENLGGVLRDFFNMLSDELDAQIYPDAQACMAVVIAKFRQLPKESKAVLTTMGKSLGRFDLQGQVSGLAAATAECHRYLNVLSTNRESKLRSYKTLGVCAGAALVIILF